MWPARPTCTQAGYYVFLTWVTGSTANSYTIYCEPCAGGYFTPAGSALACSACPVNTFSAGAASPAGIAGCTPCPSGTWTAGLTAQVQRCLLPSICISHPSLP